MISIDAISALILAWGKGTWGGGKRNGGEECGPVKEVELYLKSETKDEVTKGVGVRPLRVVETHFIRAASSVRGTAPP